MEMDAKALSSALLKTVRSERSLSQRDLASRAGVPQPTIAEIETRKREPSLTLLSRIVESTGLGLDVRLIPLERGSALFAAMAVKERLSGSGSPSEREDAALRALIDLKDALRRSSRDEFKSLVSQPPDLIGDTRWDAFLAAIVEHEAAEKGLPVPKWTDDEERTTRPFWYLSENRRLHNWERATAPSAFVRHGVFVARDELESV